MLWSVTLLSVKSQSRGVSVCKIIIDAANFSNCGESLEMPHVLTHKVEFKLLTDSKIEMTLSKFVETNFARKTELDSSWCSPFLAPTGSSLDPKSYAHRESNSKHIDDSQEDLSQATSSKTINPFEVMRQAIELVSKNPLNSEIFAPSFHRN